MAQRNNRNEIEISFDDFVNDILQNGKLHELGYHHLTTWSSFCKMLEPVAVPGSKEKHCMLHIGAASCMNDIRDSRCGKNVYFSSFSFGPPENISMWTNYGIPNPEAIRIKFTYYSILNWKRQFEQGGVSVYGVNENFELENIDELPNLKFIDVGYWSKKEIGPNAKDPNEGLFFYDNDKYRISDHHDDLMQQMDKQPYLFKDYGWAYERETRIVMIFNKPLAKEYKRIAVEFDGPINFLKKNFSKYVTCGPWYDENYPLVQPLADGLSIKKANQSRYQSLVKMRSVCDSCKQEDKAKCNCPFKGQR